MGLSHALLAQLAAGPPKSPGRGSSLAGMAGMVENIRRRKQQAKLLAAQHARQQKLTNIVTTSVGKDGNVDLKLAAHNVRKTGELKVADALDDQFNENRAADDKNKEALRGVSKATIDKQMAAQAQFGQSFGAVILATDQLAPSLFAAAVRQNKDELTSNQRSMISQVKSPQDMRDLSQAFALGSAKNGNLLTFIDQERDRTLTYKKYVSEQAKEQKVTVGQLEARTITRWLGAFSQGKDPGQVLNKGEQLIIQKRYANTAQVAAFAQTWAQQMPDTFRSLLKNDPKTAIDVFQDVLSQFDNHLNKFAGKSIGVGRVSKQQLAPLGISMEVFQRNHAANGSRNEQDTLRAIIEHKRKQSREQ